jgi:hypothetical protein
MSTLESLGRSGGGADHRIVWEATYGYTHFQHHESEGSEWSTKSRKQTVVHLIAPTYALAKALFDLKVGQGDITLVDIIPLCTINDEIDLTRGWRA